MRFLERESLRSFLSLFQFVFWEQPDYVQTGKRNGTRQVSDRPKVLSHYCPKKLGTPGQRRGLQALKFNVIALAESSPEKAGVGSSIPSLATRLNSLKSAFTDLFFRLCQICAVD